MKTTGLLASFVFLTALLGQCAGRMEQAETSKQHEIHVLVQSQPNRYYRIMWDDHRSNVTCDFLADSNGEATILAPFCQRGRTIEVGGDLMGAVKDALKTQSSNHGTHISHLTHHLSGAVTMAPPPTVVMLLFSDRNSSPCVLIDVSGALWTETFQPIDTPTSLSGNDDACWLSVFNLFRAVAANIEPLYRDRLAEESKGLNLIWAEEARTSATKVVDISHAFEKCYGAGISGVGCGEILQLLSERGRILSFLADEKKALSAPTDFHLIGRACGRAADD